MGANTTPRMKKRGRTVFGVRIGLGNMSFKPSVSTVGIAYCHALSRCWRNAVSGGG